MPTPPTLPPSGSPHEYSASARHQPPRSRCHPDTGKGDLDKKSFADFWRHDLDCSDSPSRQGQCRTPSSFRPWTLGPALDYDIIGSAPASNLSAGIPLRTLRDDRATRHQPNLNKPQALIILPTSSSHQAGRSEPARGRRTLRSTAALSSLASSAEPRRRHVARPAASLTAAPPAPVRRRQPSSRRAADEMLDSASCPDVETRRRVPEKTATPCASRRSRPRRGSSLAAFMVQPTPISARGDPRRQNDCQHGRVTSTAFAFS